MSGWFGGVVQQHDTLTIKLGEMIGGTSEATEEITGEN